MTELFIAILSTLMIILMCVQMYYALKRDNWLDFSIYALVIIYIGILMALS